MWFKVDDNLITSPKFFGIPKNRRLEAMGLWTVLGAWCANNENDGKIPGYMVEEFNADPNLAELLVYAGLWELTDDGYQFHDWTDWQPSRADLEEKRTKHREAQARYAERAGRNKKDGTPPISRQSLIDQQDVSDNPPTRPDQIEEGKPSSIGAARKRGTRLSEDWVLTQAEGDWAVEHGLPMERVLEEAEKFKDHWLSKSGRDATKVDWDRTWHNWVRTALSFGGGGSTSRVGGGRRGPLSPEELLRLSREGSSL